MEPLMWLIVLAVFLVIEAITVGLTTIWFAGGALVAAIASGAGAGILVQWILFLVISLVLLIFTRPLAVRYMNKGVPKTNVNSLIFNHEEIAPGETKVFTPVTHKQGLFSPDCYNGKSLFTMGEEDGEKED